MASQPESSAESLAPFLIAPSFVERVWGYRDLHPWYDWIAESEPIGEVWLTGDECRVSTGPEKGKRLAEVFAEKPWALVGSSAPKAESPLLVKVIFARDKLSVQVHPDDAMARKYGEPRGKTECWYAIAAEPGAQVAVGLKPGVTLDQIESEIQNETLEESLETVPVHAGDMIFVDAGTVHAIWPGSVLLETQQNSDLTYRMYDYGRPRPLHIQKSIEATRLQTRAGKVPPQVLEDRSILINVEYFCVERLVVEGTRTSSTLPGNGEPESGLAYLFAISGSARLTGEGFEPIVIPTRGIACIPATAPAFVVEDLGDLELVRISPRWPKGAA